MSGWLIFLTLIAVYRASRLITSDFITEPIRVWIENRYGTDSKRAYLVTCNWCLSVYVAPLVVVPVVLWPSNRAVVAIVFSLAASAFAGLIATWQSYFQAITPPES